MNEIVLATRNKHKVQEIRDILRGIPVRVLSLDSFPGVPDVTEDGATLEENAVKKATTVARHLKKWTLADDTGLEVERLGGEPGVFSARWAGPGCTYEDNNRKLLERLEGVPERDRAARFRCVIALADPAGKVWSVEGKVDGTITEHPRGDHGFGYDPVFLVPALRKTFAELGSGTKNSISHRACALNKAKQLIEKLLAGG